MKDYGKCVVCGKPLRAGRWKYCNLACRSLGVKGVKKPYLNRSIIKICEYCGKEMVCGGRGNRKKTNRFCSNACSVKSRRTTIEHFWEKNGKTSSAAWQEYRLEIIAEYDGKCALCKRKVNLQIHHIIPREIGGGHNKENLMPLCVKCHGSIDHLVQLLGNNKDAILSIMELLQCRT